MLIYIISVIHLSWHNTNNGVDLDRMYKVFIDGGHGTTGLEIRERLSGRDDITILEIEDRLRKDLNARVDMAKSADVTIMCLPDEASRELAAALPDDVRVIDTSTAHRVDPGWVYGMPELYPGKRNEIREAARVANPGCHATGFILLARPLIDAGVIDRDAALCCFCITGYSGGGRKMIEDYDRMHDQNLVGQDPAKVTLSAVSPAQYALGQSHKHLPEMKMMSGLDKEPVFCPVVGDFYRGMVMTIEIPGDLLKTGGCHDAVQMIRDIYLSRYEEEPLIRIADAPENGFLYSDTMSTSDMFEIMVLGNDERVLLVSRFDNLGKGASGAAVQNMNIMLGIDETNGLRI